MPKTYLFVPGNTHELERMLQEFEGKVKERQKSLEKLQDRLEELDGEALRLGRDKSRLLVQQGKLQQEAEVGVDVGIWVFVR